MWLNLSNGSRESRPIFIVERAEKRESCFCYVIMLHYVHNKMGGNMSFTRTRRNRRADEADVDMTPMLDIVFIMLIFFIVTATFLDESALDFTQAPAEPPTSSPPTPAISIYVDAKNTISIDNEAAELSSVASRVERLMADKPNAIISLRADAQASLESVVYIKDQMALAGRETIMKIDRPNKT
jgi:biopolymer transport protein ExbD